ncbi:hypothetical protein NDU88_005328 [Pleurodeles waltl]|uniref:Thioredoxin domain-containing protein n=1 Tax=Pleurodeles waltl TaxID=8319 RepID=A0AAV7WXB2_PLEWA|nr:hypothetical protein NDU88_005328 [Pleurodeles waltl]
MELAHRYYNVRFCTIDINEVHDLELCNFITGTPTFYFYRNEQKRELVQALMRKGELKFDKGKRNCLILCFTA